MWTCPRCTVENLPEASECQMCYLDRQAETEPSEWWQCPNCTQFMFAHLKYCSVCNFRRDLLGIPGTEKGKPTQPREGSGQAAKRGVWPTERGDDSGGAEGGREGEEEEEEKDQELETVWVCKVLRDSSICYAQNGLDADFCTRCGAPKPARPHRVTLAQVPRDTGHRAESFWGERETSGPQAEGRGCHDVAPLQFSSLPDDGRRSGETTTRGVAESEEAAASASLQALGLHDNQDMVLEEERLEFPDSECRLVLVGKTGNGKSATANTILGLQKRFEASFRFGSVTKKCQRHNGVRFGLHIEVVDTPGLFDTAMKEEHVYTEIVKCLSIVAPGPHALLLVLRVGVRFTAEERQAVEEVHRLFGLQLLRFLVIVFTHGDCLPRGGGSCGGSSQEEKEEQEEKEKLATLADMLADSPDCLKELISKTNHRYVIFDNTASAASKQRQVKELLVTVRNLLKVNGGRPFTNSLLQRVEGCMSQREKELGRELGRGRSGNDSRQKMFYRDIAREEVVQEQPLLTRVKDIVLPVLREVLPTIIGILVKVFLLKGAGGAGRCSLM